MTRIHSGSSVEQGRRIESWSLKAEQTAQLLAKLESHLPYSIPLLRRIQFHLHHLISSTARIFVAAVVGRTRGEPGDDVAANGNPDILETWLSEKQSHKHPWIAAHIDLANAGQTAVWAYSSWESDLNHPFPSSLTDPMEAVALTHAEPEPTQKALMRALFSYISTELIPLASTTPSEEWLSLERTGKYLSKPFSRDKVLFGTVSEKLWGVLPRNARTRTDDGYWKYIFEIESGAHRESSSRNGSVSASSLPEGYSFGVMKDENLQTVLDRSPIPRTLGTLRQYVSVGLFHDSSPAPIGWGFLGKDASLSSLHTEPEHRGKGLAVTLGAELLRRQHVATSLAGTHSTDGKDSRRVNGQAGDDGMMEEERFTWAHADVSKNNTASIRVMEKLGGKPIWMVMWTEVDMQEALAAQ